MKRFRLLALLLFPVLSGMAQSATPEKPVEYPFSTVTDSLIRKELSVFTQKGAATYLTSTTAPHPLITVPLRQCTKEQAYLNLGSTYIHLYFKGTGTERMLDSIFLVTHSHYWVKVPKETEHGLIQTNNCNYQSNSKRETFNSPYFKAFYSADKKRLYIYMLGGTANKKFEITWVFEQDAYLFQVVDELG